MRNFTFTKAELTGLTGTEIHGLLTGADDVDDCDLFDAEDDDLFASLRAGEGSTSTEATKLARIVNVDVTVME